MFHRIPPGFERWWIWSCWLVHSAIQPWNRSWFAGKIQIFLVVSEINKNWSRRLFWGLGPRLNTPYPNTYCECDAATSPSHDFDQRHTTGPCCASKTCSAEIKMMWKQNMCRPKQSCWTSGGMGVRKIRGREKGKDPKGVLYEAT